MENLKHTKGYADKLGLKQYPVVEGIHNIQLDMVNGRKRDGFILGYMKAIEETNAPELLEALKDMVFIFERLANNLQTPATGFNCYKKAINAINKATK